MKALAPYLMTLSLAGFAFTADAQSSIQQEYDDMYFTAKDRKVVKYAEEAKVAAEPVRNVQSSSPSSEFVPLQEEEDVSARNVNPEYIARYKRPGSREVPVEELNDNADSYSSEDYFVEDYAVNEADERDIIINNNYYGRNFSSFNRPWNPRFGWGNAWGFDPFWGDPFMYDPFFDPFWGNGFGPGMGWNVGWNSAWGWNVGFNYGWGNAWGWNRPWGWNSWGWNRWDPWYGSGWAYRSGFRNGFNTGYWNGYYNSPGLYTDVVNISPRRVVRGRYDSRSVSGTGTTIVDQRARTRTLHDNNGTVRSVDSRSDISNGRRDTRTFDNAQNDYYNRSRARMSNSSRENTSRSEVQRSSAGRSTTTPNYSRSRTQPSVNETPSRSRSNYSAPSNGRSNNSYTPRSRSTERYSAPSRDSNYTQRRSAPSSSRDYSSPSYSSPRERSTPSYSGGSRGSYSSGSSGRSSSPAYSGGSRSSGGSTPSRRGN